MDTSRAIEQLKANGWDDLRVLEPAAAVTRLKAIYQNAINGIRTAAAHISSGGAPEEADVSWNYPGLAFAVTEKRPAVSNRAAFGFCRRGAGVYVTTVARPELFEDYWLEQITLLAKAHGTNPIVGVSDQRIPANLGLESVNETLPDSLDQYFPRISLEKISSSAEPPAGMYPLSLYSGPMTDFCMSRLRHYTGTSPADFQQFIILTNYAMYMDGFSELSKDLLAAPDSEYTELVTPAFLNGPAIKRPQMPAFHLKRKDHLGITIININVGPSNALNITRNLCALRPHGLLMAGHGGGLRPNQRIGSFVAADGYYREDGILDEHLNRSIPIPAVAEINLAYKDALQAQFQIDRESVKDLMETGTVATVADRGWELNQAQVGRITDSRALAIDMESATIAAAGFLYRVPYGTLLCISDLPLHGKPKTQGVAHEFYRNSVNSHLKAMIAAVDIMRSNPERLHSRRLRGAFDPPVR